MNLDDFIDDLSSESPAPGGGAASAVMAVLGTALASMVCALTNGRAKYAQYQDFVESKHSQILDMQNQFKALKDEDIAAFNKISSAYKMPKETDTEKAARHEAIQQALIPATKTPFKIMQLSAKALDITDSLVGKTNVMAISDLGCAALALKSAMQGAYLNVRINISSANEDIESIGEISKELLDKYIPIADKIYQSSIVHE